MKRISDDYLAQQKSMHAAGGYGVSGHKWADTVRQLVEIHGLTTILDYGCGSGRLAEALGMTIAEYDPCIEGKDDDPERADLVVCGDVLEHVELEFIDAVLDHVRAKTKGLVLFGIALTPAGRRLPDGRNAHILLRGVQWWTRKINDRFEIVQLQYLKGPADKLVIIATRGKR